MAAPFGSGNFINSPQVVAGAGGAAIDASQGSFLRLTPTAAQTITVSGGYPGQILVLKVFTSGTSSFVTTFGAGFLTTGTLASGTTDAKTFIMVFVSFDGTTFVEVSRTTAQ